jgi:7,8-dihydroneopterin aldolase/epimerase/oxygenase
MDHIFIREFRVDAWVGIYDWEKLRAQTLELELEIGVLGPEAGTTDDIAHTVHYGLVIERVRAELAEKRFGLLEALAEHVAGLVTGEFKAPWVRLSVAKLGHARWGSRSNGAGRPEDSMLKWVLVIAVAVVVLSLFAPQLGKLGLGRLPGDVTVKFRGRLVYLPITSTVLISLVLTLMGRFI